MCLEVKWRLPRISLKPIKVYKVMFINGNIVRPYYNEDYRYLVSGAYTAENYNFKETIIDLKDGFIEKGFFHSYKEVPQHWLWRLKDRDPSKISIVECTIPRFTLYFKGKCMGDTSYASRKIKFIKYVEEY